MAGPGEPAEGRLPEWGSLGPPAVSGGRARGSHPSRAPDLRQLQRRLGWPSPAAYRAVELPSPTAGQTDCRRAVRPWTRSGGKNTVPDTTSRSTRVWARARHPAIRTHEGHPGAVR